MQGWAEKCSERIKRARLAQLARQVRTQKGSNIINMSSSRRSSIAKQGRTRRKPTHQPPSVTDDAECSVPPEQEISQNKRVSVEESQSVHDQINEAIRRLTVT